MTITREDRFLMQIEQSTHVVVLNLNWLTTFISQLFSTTVMRNGALDSIQRDQDTRTLLHGCFAGTIQTLYGIQWYDGGEGSLLRCSSLLRPVLPWKALPPTGCSLRTMTIVGHPPNPPCTCISWLISQMGSYHHHHCCQFLLILHFIMYIYTYECLTTETLHNEYLHIRMFATEIIGRIASLSADVSWFKDYVHQ